jgi:hypothetical protein
LSHADECISQTVALSIYGSAAVALYLGDTADYAYGYTDDVDVGAMEPEGVELDDVNSQIVDPPLHFQEFDFEQWVIHPDWHEATVDASELVGTSTISVLLLHPLDLIITKLSRAGIQDIEDAELLCREYAIDETPEVKDRVLEAAKYHPLSERVCGDIEWSYQAIFDAEIDVHQFL